MGKNVIIRARGMLAAMLYYFDSIDPVDWSLLSNYVINEIKKNHPKKEIYLFDKKNPCDDFLLFYKHGEGNYEILWGNSWDRGCKLMDMGTRNIIQILEPYETKEDGSHIDIIRLKDKKYREALKQVEKDYSKILFETLSHFNNSEEKEKYYKYKEERLRQARNQVSKLNVLLLSDKQEDYDTLVRCGFTNINWFRSIVRAKQYFDQNPAQLSKHHLILRGDDLFSRYGTDLGFGKMIDEACNQKTIQQFKLYTRYEPSIDDRRRFSTFRCEVSPVVGIRQDYGLCQDDVNTEEVFYSKLPEYIVLKYPNNEIPHYEFKKIEDHITPDTLPYPEKLEDIKILTYGLDNSIKEKYGLNITRCEDLFADYDEKMRYLKSHLGDYDIIITDQESTGKMLRGIEAEEQCKDTGRPLVLMLYNKYFDVDDNNCKHVEFTIKYCCGGKNKTAAPTTEYTLNSIPNENEAVRNNAFKSRELIRTALTLYNKELINQGVKPIELPFESSDEMNSKYKKAKEEKDIKDHKKYLKEMELRELDEANVGLINEFDSFKKILIEYLKYYRPGVIKDQINIIENRQDNEITIELLHPLNHTALGSITIDKNNLKEGIRTFKMQLAKEKLASEQKLAIYQNCFNGKDGIPRRPNKDEAKLLSRAFIKIKELLPQLIEDAKEEDKKRQNRGKKGYYKKRDY